MELTGNCKVEFEKWYLITYGVLTGDFSNEATFWELDNNMQYGVLVDYFDSVILEVQMFKEKDSEWWDIYINNDWEITRKILRPEARTKAIDKANEIRNQQLEDVNT